jgi:hypothetical protein
LDELLSVLVVLHHLTETRRLFRPTNPQHHLQLPIPRLQIALLEGSNEISIDDQRAVGNVDNPNVQVRA